MGAVETFDRSTRDAATLDTREYLTFRLGGEEYGIDILAVQEIRGYEQPTRIANAAPFIKGVVNLRGVIVPIVDLRIRFGLGQPEYDEFTVVIVLDIGSRVVGIVVDNVSDVVGLKPDETRAAPDMSSVVDSQYIVGLGRLGERMLILLDIAGLMTSPEMELSDAR